MKDKENFQKATINFKYNWEPMEFAVYHNLSEFGLSIHDAFDNWWPRTEVFTEASFCEYVMSKDSGIVCLNEKQFMEKYG